VQPRFFCGQLLTDQDLRQLLTWTRDKLRLDRFRDGWGVVCGLEVSCDPARPSVVRVGPGYAVSCCGDDIIVCDDACLDLRDACCKPADPCQDPCGGNQQQHAAAQQQGGAEKGKQLTEFEQRMRQAFAPCNSQNGEDGLYVVDLFIHYEEEPTDSIPVLGRGACQSTATCEPSRTRETHCLSSEPACCCDDPRVAVATRWKERLDQCHTLIREVSDIYLHASEARNGNASRLNDRLRDVLLRWIDAHPAERLCGVRDAVCAIKGDVVVDEVQLARLVFYLVQECRNRYVSATCHECKDGRGVPLARVYLRAGDGSPTHLAHTDGQCCVVWIDPYPPYRRLLSRDDLPALPGTFNAGHLIWQRPNDVALALAESGIALATKAGQEVPIGSLGELLVWEPGNVFLDPNTDPILQYVVDPVCREQRVVGFGGSRQGEKDKKAAGRSPAGGQADGEPVAAIPATAPPAPVETTAPPTRRPSRRSKSTG
jgi:hypothetical protein